MDVRPKLDHRRDHADHLAAAADPDLLGLRAAVLVLAVVDPWAVKPAPVGRTGAQILEVTMMTRIRKTTPTTRIRKTSPTTRIRRRTLGLTTSSTIMAAALLLIFPAPLTLPYRTTGVIPPSRSSRRSAENRRTPLDAPPRPANLLASGAADRSRLSAPTRHLLPPPCWRATAVFLAAAASLVTAIARTRRWKAESCGGLAQTSAAAAAAEASLEEKVRRSLWTTTSTTGRLVLARGESVASSPHQGTTTPCDLPPAQTEIPRLHPLFLLPYLRPPHRAAPTTITIIITSSP